LQWYKSKTASANTFAVYAVRNVTWNSVNVDESPGASVATVVGASVVTGAAVKFVVSVGVAVAIGAAVVVQWHTAISGTIIIQRLAAVMIMIVAGAGSVINRNSWCGSYTSLV
jgi:hypothetical protein